MVDVLSVAALVVAYGLVVTGVCLLSVPWGLVTAGALLGVFALFVDLNPKGARRR